MAADSTFYEGVAAFSFTASVVALAFAYYYSRVNPGTKWQTWTPKWYRTAGILALLGTLQLLRSRLAN